MIDMNDGERVFLDTGGNPIENSSSDTIKVRILEKEYMLVGFVKCVCEVLTDQR